MVALPGGDRRLVGPGAYFCFSPSTQPGELLVSTSSAGLGPLHRPRPEDFLELVERSKRGRLKIYLGFAAGVGKTYRMLEEAHALAKRGVDVVIGLVETHGRAETATLV